MRYAEIGEISSGTLRPEDLLETFAETLRSLLKIQPKGFPKKEHRRLIREADFLLGKLEEGGDEPETGDVLADLSDALGDFAPPYCYFGTLEGDGACFGFWPDLDRIDEEGRYGSEVMKLDAGDDIPPEFRGYVAMVSDHGNIEFGAARGGKFKPIWSCV